MGIRIHSSIPRYNHDQSLCQSFFSYRMTPRDKKLIISLRDQHNLDWTTIGRKLRLDPLLCKLYYTRTTNIVNFAQPNLVKSQRIGGIFGIAVMKERAEKPMLSLSQLGNVVRYNLDLKVTDEMLGKFIQQQNI